MKFVVVLSFSRVVVRRKVGVERKREEKRIGQKSGPELAETFEPGRKDLSGVRYDHIIAMIITETLL